MDNNTAIVSMMESLDGAHLVRREGEHLLVWYGGHTVKVFMLMGNKLMIIGSFSAHNGGDKDLPTRVDAESQVDMYVKYL